MQQAPSTGNGDAQASALSTSWDAWEEYYRQASIRRRTRGGRRQLRDEKRRRRLRERIGLAVSAFLVGGMTLIFYIVLTHH
jgi:hypothetical protein